MAGRAVAPLAVVAALLAAAPTAGATRCDASDLAGARVTGSIAFGSAAYTAPGGDACATQQEGREVVWPAQRFGDIAIRSKIYVPEGRPFVRQLWMLQNVGMAPVAPTVRRKVPAGDLVVVWQGAGSAAGRVPAERVRRFRADHRLLLAPGETQVLMQLLAVRATPAVLAAAPEPVSEGMTDVEKLGLQNFLVVDADGDGVDNDADNCPFRPNNAQADGDDDQSGNACDNDDDDHGNLDAMELGFGAAPLAVEEDDDDGLFDPTDLCGRPTSQPCRFLRRANGPD